MSAGSVPWLLRHELRLAWRGGARSNRRLVAVMLLAAFVVLAVVAGLPLSYLLQRWTPSLTPSLALGLDAVLVLIVSLMLSQTISQAVETFYSRRDLDLLLSSPIPASRVLAVRCLSLAATTTATYLALLAPILLTIAVMGHPRWLNLFLVLVAAGLLATTFGLLAAMGLFALIGPRRTRTAAQMLAAFVGAAFFLAAQVFNFARDLVGARFAAVVEGWLDSGAFGPSSPLSWPARAALGEPGPALGLLAGAGGLFVLTVSVLGRRFADNAAAAVGRHAGRTPRSDRAGAGGFARTLTGTVVRKELKLLRRDPQLISQVCLRLLYLFPLLFLLWRSGGHGDGVAVSSLAAAVVFLTGQLAGSLAWVTVSGEDAPDLLAVAPAGAAPLRRAKALAALIPVGVVMAVPLAGFAVVSPWAGLVALAGCAAAACSAALLALWLGKPGARRDFNKRQSGSVLANLAEFVIGGAWSGATALAVAGSLWTLAPIAFAALLLAGLRRRALGDGGRAAPQGVGAPA